jgi:hypothetical protein
MRMKTDDFVYALCPNDVKAEVIAKLFPTCSPSAFPPFIKEG